MNKSLKGEMIHVAKRLTTLCYLPNGKLVCYKRGNLLVLNEDSTEFTYPIFRNIKEKLLGRSTLLSRLFRLGIRTAVALNDNIIILSYGNILYEYNLNLKTLSQGYVLAKGIRPLIFSIIKGIEGFEDAIVFGGYLINSRKNPVNIYKRIGKDKWEVLYTFQQGVINHVHNIIPDPYRNCLWIFSGDHDEAAAIWKVTDNFKRVDCLLSNDQLFRACSIFPTTQGLIYATDTPYKENYICLMKEDLSIERIFSISGPCIYGCLCGNKYVFSTTVESDGRNQTLFKLVFSKKLGRGISDNYVHLYTGNLKLGFKEIYKEKKDWLPFIFQFGTIRFPYGENKSNRLYFQPIGTIRNDFSILKLDI